MLQNTLLPLWLILGGGGILLALYSDWRTSALLLITIIYYFVMNSIMHMEHRYNLPLHALLLVFAGFTIQRSTEIIGEAVSRYRAKSLSVKSEGRGMKDESVLIQVE